MKLLPVILSTLFVAALPAFTQNVIRDPGFEEGEQQWNFYIPSDSVSRDTQFSIVTDEPYSGQACALLESSDNARFSISPKGMPLPVSPGEKFRLSLWVKASEDFRPEPGHPGMLIRVDLLQDREPLQIVSVDWKGTTHVLEPTEKPVDFTTEPIPTKWNQVTFEFTIPEDIDSLRPSLFLWRGTGKIWIDDFILQRIKSGERE